MIYRLLSASVIIFYLHIFWIPAGQSSAAMEKTMGSIKTVSLSQISYHHDLDVQIADSLASEEVMGHIVPSECVTSRGMLVEGTSQTDAYLMRNLFVSGILFIAVAMVLLKKRTMIEKDRVHEQDFTI